MWTRNTGNRPPLRRHRLPLDGIKGQTQQHLNPVPFNLEPGPRRKSDVFLQLLLKHADFQSLRKYVASVYHTAAVITALWRLQLQRRLARIGVVPGAGACSLPGPAHLHNGCQVTQRGRSQTRESERVLKKKEEGVEGAHLGAVRCLQHIPRRSRALHFGVCVPASLL